LVATRSSTRREPVIGPVRTLGVLSRALVEAFHHTFSVRERRLRSTPAGRPGRPLKPSLGFVEWRTSPSRWLNLAEPGALATWRLVSSSGWWPAWWWPG